MPYISQEDRERIKNQAKVLLQYVGVDPMEALILALRTFPLDERKGQLNYVLSRIALGTFKDGPWSYHSISRVKSVLLDARDEVERRLMGPREGKAMLLNGDLPEYS